MWTVCIEMLCFDFELRLQLKRTLISTNKQILTHSLTYTLSLDTNASTHTGSVRFNPISRASAIAYRGHQLPAANSRIAHKMLMFFSVYRWARSERKASNEFMITTVPHRHRHSRLLFLTRWLPMSNYFFVFVFGFIALVITFWLQFSIYCSIVRLVFGKILESNTSSVVQFGYIHACDSRYRISEFSGRNAKITGWTRLRIWTIKGNFDCVISSSQRTRETFPMGIIVICRRRFWQQLNTASDF